MKVLVNTPDINILGGVANHYKGLKNYWTEDVSYNFIGGRNGIPGSVILIYDLLKFIFKCMFFQPDVIILNPSLGKTAIKRDAVYLRISKFFNIKTVVFFHGWNKDQEKLISENPENFKTTFNKADTILVLASEFKEKLKGWGIYIPIKLTTTKVDDSLIGDVDIEAKKYGNTLLFLARIVKEKGIFITLKVFKMIKSVHPEAKLIVAGSGSALQDAKEFVSNNDIPDVEFTGFITGKELIKVYKSSDLYLFPTVHGEGMPTSVLEAMAFGLPVISRPVGGMVDFFEEEKMGYLVESLEPDEYFQKTVNLLGSRELLKKMGQYNHQYAKKNFMASEVARSMEDIFKEIIKLK